MDGLGWDSSEVEDSFLISNSDSSIYGDKMNLQEDIFINPIQQLQMKPDSDIVSEMVLQTELPASDSVNVASNFDMLKWRDGLTQEWCFSPFLNRSSASVSDVGLAVHGATTTSSLESLDCLLSATNSNSNTDTSVDDDGISMIFSDCKSLWNFVATHKSTSTASAAVSARESENTGVNTGNETVSQCSSDQYIINNNIKQSETKSGSSKRYQVGLNFGYFNLLHTDTSATGNGSENQPKAKKPRLEKAVQSTSNINFQLPSCSSASSSMDEPDTETIAQMKEMIYRAAAFRPVNLGTEVVEKPKRKNVRISTDPQTVAARQRREKISEKIRVLQRLVPGGNKMDTASMLDEAANYLKFLRSQVKALENLGHPMQTHNLLFLNPNHIHHP